MISPVDAIETHNPSKEIIPMLHYTPAQMRAQMDKDHTPSLEEVLVRAGHYRKFDFADYQRRRKQADVELRELRIRQAEKNTNRQGAGHG